MDELLKRAERRFTQEIVWCMQQAEYFHHTPSQRGWLAKAQHITRLLNRVQEWMNDKYADMAE